MSNILIFRNFQCRAKTIWFIFFIIMTTSSCDNLKKLNIDVNHTSKKDSIYIKDYQQYWDIVAKNFAYFDTRRTDWGKVKNYYQPIVDTITNKKSFITVLEKSNYELYNGHLGLNTHNPNSFRVIPTSSELTIKKNKNKFFIESIRQNSNAEKTGLKVGMEVVEHNNEKLTDALSEVLPISFKDYDNEVYEFAANVLLAGKRNQKSQIIVRDKNEKLKFELNPKKSKSYYKSDDVLLVERDANNIGYIKINNSLGDNSLITAFDNAIDTLMDTKALILDLRETPSGGNNTIAKALMGRLINKEESYQRYRYVFDEKLTGIEFLWLEQVSPRKTIYTKPIVLLVGRWTGSMGEGIAIGLDSFKRADIVGTKMAGLLGAVWQYTLENTKIGIQLPGIKLYHIDTTPREDFVPEYNVVDNDDYLKIANKIIKDKTR
ncbi:carboxyl-terminal processing protease [Nonlabens sp. Hel1_33_55]|uniref:S41 family peptidase n=1 Tax=Nonlabens sp. Hel1_33_55 TaxID=1336802 RepID=UPI000875D083|nr:S41 family peptidase [Nonlabens sp. Hel1_33_55]SCY00055.1 carboxyl-terminal processing protease [Nonlabens sp. Hel1_33_55]